ncbi:carbohydrate-binding protein CenC [Histomonas meleagridis]|uniref:carbohydrate-binding protein CenC n=1 Tax=Histomonas meleagridis TaxID=135588 RepID=UPI00355965C1|nr:carbohydrate-binding protein CenC [Histomonas meleagridis]KAH0802258.1 carbohydrate-binding protein CenC [Histomonas meleagridis]
MQPPKYWRYESHYQGRRRGGHNTSNGGIFVLDFSELDDSRFLGEVNGLIPGKRYSATVHAVGTDIVPQYPNGVGANICVFGTWDHSTEFNNGVNSFEGDLTVDFRAKDTKVTIGLRLGYWGCEAKGKVIFSNFKIQESDKFITFGEGIIRFEITIDDLQEIDPFEDKIELFLNRMSNVYKTMGQLYGKYPFNGETIYYETRENIGAYAIAGNPIFWNNQCCIDYFVNHVYTDACFGTIHEMGHDFDQTALGELNHEMMANFALCYAVERLNLPIHFDNELTVGRGLQDGFYRRSYERSIMIGKYHHDGLLYCILRIKDNIGWSAFEEVMRRLIKNPPPKFNHPSQILNCWMSMLSELVHFDVRTFFPQNEYQFLMQQEHY